ncbi:MAG: hypothetical protein EKK40_06535 [Bradyrhizobiaceae bacterium]|nr:MAG: hypothetical protein EKK40_06535 [Bradyrhizobiaceae bacterium]
MAASAPAAGSAEAIADATGFAETAGLAEAEAPDEVVTAWLAEASCWPPAWAGLGAVFGFC